MGGGGFWGGGSRWVVRVNVYRRLVGGWLRFSILFVCYRYLIEIHVRWYLFIGIRDEGCENVRGRV